MAKYQVQGLYARVIYGEVDADDDDEALDKAFVAIEEMPDDDWDDLGVEVTVMEL